MLDTYGYSVKTATVCRQSFGVSACNELRLMCVMGIKLFECINSKSLLKNMVLEATS